MELLEDADGMVRDAAKHTAIELFRYVTCLCATKLNTNSVVAMRPILPSPISSDSSKPLKSDLRSNKPSLKN